MVAGQMRQRERRIFLTLDVLKTSQRHHRLEAPLPRQVVVKLSRLAQQGEEVTRGAFNLDVTLAGLANDVDDRAELDEPRLYRVAFAERAQGIHLSLIHI